MINEGSTRKSYAWTVLITLSIVNAINYLDRTIISILIPLIKRDMALTDSSLGAIMGIAFASSYAIFAIPIARLADVSNRKNIIAVSLFVWSSATALASAVQTTTQLFLARVLVGVGEAGCIPSSQSILCDYFDHKNRHLALSVYTSGAFVGVTVGIFGGGMLAELFGWRATLLIVGLPGILVALFVWLFLREPQRGRFDREGGGQVPKSFMMTLKYLMSSKFFVILLIAISLQQFSLYATAQWLPSFYDRSHLLPVATIGLYLGGTYGVGAFVGTLIGGYIGTRLCEVSPALPLRFAGSMLFVAVPAGMVMLFGNSYGISFVGTFFFFLFTSAVFGPFYSSVMSSITADSRASAAATIAFFGALIGLGAGPTVVGVVSDYLGPSLGAQSLKWALVIAIAMPAVGALFFRMASRYQLVSHPT